MRKRRHVGWAVFALVFVAFLGVGFGLWHSGYRVYVIHTGSMQPTANPGDLIIDRPPSGNYRPGEVITFRHSAGPDVVTHRITDISSGKIHTKGDANPTPDVWEIPLDMVQGSVQWKITGLGYFVVFLQQPAGFASLFTVPFGLFLLWKLWFPGLPQEPTGAVETAAVDPPSAGSAAEDLYTVSA